MKNDNDNVLFAAMAERCRALIHASSEVRDLPAALHPKHLLWMCGKIERHAAEWPGTRVSRWIGFVQCAMVANGMLDLASARTMFDDAKNAHGGDYEDTDLIDHLDTASEFAMELGGEQ